MPLDRLNGCPWLTLSYWFVKLKHYTHGSSIETVELVMDYLAMGTSKFLRG